MKFYNLCRPLTARGEGCRVRLQETHIVCGRSPGDRDAERVGPGHVRNTGEVLPAQTAEPLDGGSEHDVSTSAGNNGQEKEW